MNQISRNNHYVPKQYLKNWLNPFGKIWTYSLLVPDRRIPNWLERSVDSVGCQRDLYSAVIEDSELDEFEKWLNEYVEQPSKIVIQKLINDEKLKGKDCAILSNYIAAQYARTPGFLIKRLKYYKEYMPDFIYGAINKAVADLEVKINNGIPIPSCNSNETSKFIPSHLKLLTSTPTGGGVFEFKTVLGRGFWLFELKHLIENVSDILKKHNWIVFKPSHGNWITSDDPVICLNYYGKNHYDFKGGWGSRGSEILLPLSPKHMLYTRVGCTDLQSEKFETPYITGMVQKLLFEHAFRCIYSLEPFESVTSCRERTVDKDLYVNEKELWKSWHNGQVEAERNLHNSEPEK